jgi:ParB-like chromosome segregation protein Spo0J
MDEQTSVGLAINTIEPHPDFLLRFKYNDPSLDELAESIRQLGQIHNGRVVPKPDASGYLVYVGIRRYFAVQKLFKETEDQRFAKYYAAIDEGLSEAEMLAKALAENMSEKGERKDLSALEEVAIFRRAEKLLSGSGSQSVLKLLNKEPEYLKRRLSLAEKVSEQKLRKLYEIEVASRFEFRMGHLEFLKDVPDERQFFVQASIIADAGLKPSQVSVVESLPEHAVKIPWFSSLFPEYTKSNENAKEISMEVEPPSGEQIRALSEILKGRDSTPGSTVKEPVQPSPSKNAPESPQMPVYEQDMLFVRCPRCSAYNPCKLQERVEVTFFTPKADGVIGKESVVPRALYRLAHACRGCGKDFFIVLSPGEGTINAEGLKSDVLKEPEPKTPAGALDWDPQRGSWVKIVDGDTSDLPATWENES